MELVLSSLLLEEPDSWLYGIFKGFVEEWFSVGINYVALVVLGLLLLESYVFVHRGTVPLCTL